MVRVIVRVLVTAFLRFNMDRALAILFRSTGVSPVWVGSRVSDPAACGRSETCRQYRHFNCCLKIALNSLTITPSSFCRSALSVRSLFSAA